MSADAAARIEHQVREQIRKNGMDPARDLAAVRALVDDALGAWEEQALVGAVPPVADPDATVKTVLDNVAGLGPLQCYLDDPEIEEIWINSPRQVFVARRGEPELTTTLLTAEQVRDLVEQMLSMSGRRLDLSSPFVDATLPGGERLHAVIPDVTREHWSVNMYGVLLADFPVPVFYDVIDPAAAPLWLALGLAALNVKPDADVSRK